MIAEIDVAGGIEVIDSEAPTLDLRSNWPAISLGLPLRLDGPSLPLKTPPWQYDSSACRAGERVDAPHASLFDN